MRVLQILLIKSEKILQTHKHNKTVRDFFNQNKINILEIYIRYIRHFIYFLTSNEEKRGLLLWKHKQ